jgi:diacylglycerol kinase (ATP)
MLPIRRRNTFLRALRYSIQGIVYAFHAEANMRRHFWLFNGLALIELILRPSFQVVAVTIFVSMCVFMAELLNTAIELTVDFVAKDEQHHLAGLAKDTAAGAVALVSFGSLFVAGWLLVSTWPWRFDLLSRTHWFGAIVILMVVILLGILRFLPYRPPVQPN